MKFKLIVFSVSISLFGLLSVAEASPPFSNHTQWGEMKPLGNGEIQTFATVSPQGRLKNVGVYFSAAMLENLPTEASDGHWDVKDSAGNVVLPCCGHEVVLDFPVGAPNPFQHFVLNWNPEGHGPPTVYDLPHFDFHFYMISNKERMAIRSALLFDEVCWVPNAGAARVCESNELGCHPTSVTCPTFLEGIELLPDEQMPSGYLPGVAVEPGMGNHWGDPTSAEFQGEVFTKTWIYGAFGGKLTFMEPMITKAFLEEAKNRTSVSFATPEAFPVAGSYPTQYSIYYLKNKNAYVVALERMASFE